MDVDGYNLPSSILGPHPEEFYGAVGRIVCICAVLEQQLAAMRYALAEVQQGQYSHQPVSEQFKVAGKLSRRTFHSTMGRGFAISSVVRTVRFLRGTRSCTARSRRRPMAAFGATGRPVKRQ